MSTLYVIATPIGNLGDITLRALETLKTVDVVAAEDTRQTHKLLSAHSISKPLVSCRAANEAASAKGLIKWLSEGKTIAYCSDAGTPGISDPGSILVSLVREAGFPVVPLPGPSAFSTLLSVVGMPGKAVLFEGFLQIKPGKRKKRLVELLSRSDGAVIYESPFRILKLLGEISDIDKERLILVGREMTKIHEEFVRGTAEEVLQDFQQRSIIKGEFAVFISGQKDA